MLRPRLWSPESPESRPLSARWFGARRWRACTASFRSSARWEGPASYHSLDQEEPEVLETLGRGPVPRLLCYPGVGKVCCSRDGCWHQQLYCYCTTHSIRYDHCTLASVLQCVESASCSQCQTKIVGIGSPPPPRIQNLNPDLPTTRSTQPRKRDIAALYRRSLAHLALQAPCAAELPKPTLARLLRALLKPGAQ